MSYKAPINDIKFAMDHMSDFSKHVKDGMFNDINDELVEAVLYEAGKFAANEIAPLNRVGDEKGCTLHINEDGYNHVTTAPGWKETYKNWCEAGWAGLPHTEEFGGQGLPNVMSVAVTEMWNAASMAFGIGPVLTQGAADAIEILGTDEQKNTYLEQIISGNWSATMNLTEPDVGSDLAELTCKAVPDEDGNYRLHGTKIFITYGEQDCSENIIHLVLARIEGAPKGVKGLSLFIVPKILVNEDGSLGERNDLEAIGLEEKMGIHGSPTCTMEFGGNQGAKAYLIGGENKGINGMFMMMNSARLMVGIQGVAIGERAYQHALNYANERKQGKRPDSDGKMVLIKNHPDIKHMLLKARTQTLASRAIAYNCALALDLMAKGGDLAEKARYQADFLTPLAKAYSTDMGIETASLGVQVHGGMGFIEEAGAAQHYRDARIAAIYEGTNGIQAMDLVGRKLSMDNGATANEYIDAVDALADQIMDLEGYGKIAYRLKEAATDAREATSFLLEAKQDNPDVALSAATNYQMLMGTLLGAYYIAKGAVNSDGVISNHDEYVILARFFAENLLPKTTSLAKMIKDGSEIVTEAPDDMFDVM